jgi:hypothetical protein
MRFLTFSVGIVMGFGFGMMYVLASALNSFLGRFDLAFIDNVELYSQIKPPKGRIQSGNDSILLLQVLPGDHVSRITNAVTEHSVSG